MARAAAGLCAALARRGHRVTVATALLDPGHPREEEREGVRVLRFDGPAFLRRGLIPWSPALGPWLGPTLRATDIVHVHGHRSGLAGTASAACAAAAVPYLLQTHGTYPHHHQRRLAKLVVDACWGRRVMAAARALVAVSAAEARDLPRAAKVIPNGVEACGRAPRRLEPEPWLLFVGSEAFRSKRTELLAPLLDALPEVRLHVVGRTEGLRQRLGRFGDRVRFSGVLGGDDLASAYASAHLLVHPAVEESFGLVPFEAALLGTAAVVASGHGCGEWYARAGGCVVPPDDIAAMAAAVRQRLERPAQPDAEAQAVAAFTRRELTWDRAAEAMEALYRDVLAGASAA
jgi:glycosyltransferase involved in cell wall biosynthesis